MSYELAGSANTICVDANTASSGFAIVAVFSVLVFLAVWNGFALFRRHRPRGERASRGARVRREWSLRTSGAVSS